MSAMHLREAARIWRQLGFEDESGILTLNDIIKNSRYLSRVCPDILERYGDVAERGGVSFEAFQALYVGVPVSSSSSKSKCRSTPHMPNQYSTTELRAIFDTIDSDGSGTISLADLVQQHDFVQETVPAMLSQWTEIDVNERGHISWDEFRMFFGDVDAWLEYQLSEVVGMDELKDQIRRFYRGVVLDQLRRQRGHQVGSEGAKHHMIFQGNPGTGKTSLARLMARLLHRVGIAPRDNLVEVQQEQLVAGFVGQTAPKTQKVIEEAAGGVLFIDEAYRLSQGTGNNDFGKEAIEQLMAAMNDPPCKAPIMIFAGYPADMHKFMSQNDGLYRRMPFTFNFPNYTCSELAEIFEVSVAKQGFTLDRRLLENGRQELAGIIERFTLPQSRALMNGGLCERLFALAKEALDLRDDPLQPSVMLNAADITFACKQLPPPPGAAPLANGDAAAGNGVEVENLQSQLKQLRAENADLHREVEQVRREAAQGTDVDVFNATFIPSAALQGTTAAELRGIQELLKEVRRLRAEVQERDVRLEEKERENLELANRLRKAEAGALGGHIVPGTPVQYYSASLTRWIDAVVVSFYDGKYDLDVKKAVLPDRVRRRGIQGGC